MSVHRGGIRLGGPCVGEMVGWIHQSGFSEKSSLTPFRLFPRSLFLYVHLCERSFSAVIQPTSVAAVCSRSDNPINYFKLVGAVLKSKVQGKIKMPFDQMGRQGLGKVSVSAED